MEKRKKKLKSQLVETDNYTSWTKFTFCSTFKVKKTGNFKHAWFASASKWGSSSCPRARLRSGQTARRCLSQRRPTAWAGRSCPQVPVESPPRRRAPCQHTGISKVFWVSKKGMSSWKPETRRIKAVVVNRVQATLPTAEGCGLGFFGLFLVWFLFFFFFTFDNEGLGQ